MKKAISLILVLLLALLCTGCAQVDYDDGDVIYDEIQAAPILYDTAEGLANAADCVFEGVVVDISFLTEQTSNSFYICTTYKVWVTDRYKGGAGIVEDIIVPSGIKGQKVNAQVQALREAGDQAPYSITIDNNVPVLEIGKSYIFFAGEHLNDELYEGGRPAAARMQFAINSNTDLTWVAGEITQEEVYEYFGVNPVVRTVLRIGLFVVIIAGVAVTRVFVIRKKKKKAVPEETEEPPEET